MNLVWKVLAIIALGLAIALSSAIGKLFVKKAVNGQKGGSVNEETIMVASQINSKLPMMIDSETRLDKTVGYKTRFRFNYTLINHTSSNISAHALENALTEKLANNLCSNKDLQSFRESGIAMDYAYFGNDGKEITVISIHPSICKNTKN
jgi:hypothetical protein